MNHLSPLLTQSSNICAVRGQGSWLFDKDDNRWLDFTSGIGVTSTGHCHPKVVAATQQQVATLVHAQYATVTHPNMLTLTDRLNDKLPDNMDSVAFSNAGTESVEAALRLARQATGRANIVAFRGGYHGRTLAAASVTTSANKVRTGWHPLMAGVSIAPFPHFYRFRQYGWDADTVVDFCLKELDEMMATECNPQDIAAMIIEPVQGEYGYFPATTAFMQGLRQRCDEHGILLIVDEVQAGYGRTGSFWSHSHFGAQADIMVTAKGLASGYPLSAICASKSLMEKGYPGSQGGTYGANAVACAAALATLDVMEEENLLDNVNRQSKTLRSHIDALAEQHDCIDDVRGMGLMLGLEIADANRHPDGDRAARLLKECERNGLLMLRCGSHGQVVRWLPPLTVNHEEIELAVATFSKALEATA